MFSFTTKLYGVSFVGLPVRKSLRYRFGLCFTTSVLHIGLGLLLFIYLSCSVFLAPLLHIATGKANNHTHCVSCFSCFLYLPQIPPQDP